MKKTNKSLLIIITILVLQISIQIAPARSASERTKDDLLAAFIDLCEAHPTLSSYATIGTTVENRSILAFRIGNPKGGVVMWDSTLHGGEVAGGEVAYLMAKWVLENSTSDPYARRILERNYLIFIPVINLDTYNRQNMRRVYDFGNGTVVDIPYGVNLNRNFVYNWGKSGTNNKYDRSEYRGLYPGSEPETQAIINALQTYHPSFYINTHQGGGPWLGNWWECDQDTTNWIVNRISNISSASNVTPYRVQTIGLGGMAVADAYYSGSHAWLLELDSGEDWDQNTIQATLFPKCLPIIKAMCEYSEASTVNYTIEYGGHNTNVTIDSNLNIFNFMYNHTSEKFGFNVSGQLGRTGFCNVTFSTELLDAPYTVLIDGSPIIPVLESNSTHTSIYFKYPQNTQYIEISETTPVPEFPTIIALLAVLTTLTLLLQFARRNTTFHNSNIAANQQRLRSAR